MACGGYAVRGRLGRLLVGEGRGAGAGPVALRRVALDAEPELLQRDILTTRQLQHANILPYLDTFVSGLYLYIVSPLMTYGSCRDLINRHYSEGLPESACCLILRETLQGLDYIHKKGYIHRGIRSSHVLVCSSGKVCLSGLKTAASLLHQGKRQKTLHALPPADQNNISLLWLSPELLEQNLRGYDEKSDIYSIGMLSCELGNGAIPFSGIPTTLMLTEKVRGNAPQLLDCTTFHKVMNVQNHQDESILNEINLDENSPGGSGNLITQIYANRKFNSAFHQFTNMCLEREPTLRPNCSQLLNHIFFKQIKSESLAEILTEAKPIEEESCDMSTITLEEQLSSMEVNNLCEWDF